MYKKLAAALLLAGALAGAVAIYFVQGGAPQRAPLQQTAAVEPATIGRIDFSLPDLDGKMRKLSDWEGKARIVNFWATWCAPCRREIPLLKQAQADHAGNNLQVIGVAVDFVEPVKAYAEEADFNYPLLVGQEDAMAAVETSGLQFVGLPVTMIIAPDGELLTTHIGEIVESHVEQIVDVFARLEARDLDLAGARAALKDL